MRETEDTEEIRRTRRSARPSGVAVRSFEDSAQRTSGSVPGIGRRSAGNASGDGTGSAGRTSESRSRSASGSAGRISESRSTSGSAGRTSESRSRSASRTAGSAGRASETRSRTAVKSAGNRNSGKYSKTRKRKKRKSFARRHIRAILGIAAVFVLAAVVFMLRKPFSSSDESPEADGRGVLTASEKSSAGGESEQPVEMAARKDSEEVEEVGEAEEVKPLESSAEPESFSPHCTESTRPENLIQTTGIMVDDTVLPDVSSYTPQSEISFGLGKDYTDLEGIVTFRGDNFRNSPSYGFAEMKEYALEGIWSRDTGSLSYSDASWSGSGWTGQPLMMKWPKEMKAHMNMEDWAKEDDDLVEVIYACMDGYIYFTDLKTGKPTRESMYVGYTFKGAGALDPRGYPVMYVGAGYDSYEGQARVFIINLLDCSVMYTFGNADPFTTRGSLSYFDSSPLVDAETDTLIYPGENGILYLIHLNSQYNGQEGTFSINPDHVVKWNYYGVRTDVSSYWTGMETSAAIYKGYLYVADNGGNLMCLNLNTLQLVWVQDTLDDSNSTPVLAVEDGRLYIYVSTSFHLGWRSSYTAAVPIWKIDAQTGEIVWRTDYECFSESGVSGGVQSTIAVGKGDLSDYIYVTVARTGAEYEGVLSCINKHTGEIVWEHRAFYAWSSPVCVYNSDGTGKVIYCSCAGKMYLLDGKTGETHDDFVLCDGAIESSPAVYNNYIVVGTRTCKIWGIQLK